MSDTYSKLHASYLHVQRVLEVIGTATVSDSPDRGVFIARLSEAFAKWLGEHRPPTLGQLILRQELAVGTLFTHFDAFFCRGMAARRSGRSQEQPIIRTKVTLGDAEIELSAAVSPEHLTTDSSADHLSGRKRLFFTGVISAVTKSRIEARPVVIGLLSSNVFGTGFGIAIPAADSYGEVHPTMIDSFAAARDVTPPTIAEMQALRHVPEKEIKHAFAEIIGEPFVPKDWGGETSDLFSSRVVLDGRPVNTAFAFKGPAKFHPMTLNDFGHNGSQIVRLFSEPAELLIVQHCHAITSPVRKTMQAFAMQPGNNRRFSLIDGAETIRILCTYGKLGFRKSRIPDPPATAG